MNDFTESGGMTTPLDIIRNGRGPNGTAQAAGGPSKLALFRQRLKVTGKLFH